MCLNDNFWVGDLNIQIVTSGTVVTLNNLLVCLETDYFFSTSSRKNNQFQDFTRADYLVQRPGLVIIWLIMHPV